MKIIFTGDLVVNTKYEVSNIDQKVIDKFTDADYRIVNLEAPITESTKKITKVGPNLKMHHKSIKDVLKILNVDCVALANNHVRDYGDQGVEDTLKFCRENDIETFGAGMNLDEASKTKIIETKEGRIAFVNIAENEWCNATEWTGGANPMDLIDNSAQIREARQSADWVFVIVHGGHEYYNLPSPRMQKYYRFYADQGADAVIAHHTHCISGYEIYNEVPIFYSLANFLFTKKSIHEDWYQGLVLELKLNSGKLDWTLLPIKASKDNFRLEFNDEDSKLKVFNRIDDYNFIINDQELLRKEWSNFVESKAKSFLVVFSPLNHIKNRYIRGFLRRLNLLFYSRYGLKQILNYIRCEAHRDISYTYLRKKLNTPDPEIKW